MDTYGFGDVRLDERGSWMLEQIVALQPQTHGPYGLQEGWLRQMKLVR